MISKEEVVPVGKFRKTHALKGEMNLSCELPPEYFKEGNPVIIELDGILVPFYADSIRNKGNGYLIKLSGIDSEAEASRFINKDMYILKKEVEKWVEESEDFSLSLVGYSIIDAKTGVQVGEIMDIEDSTANILFIVKKPDGEEVYIPAAEDLIESIQDDTRSIVMEVPDGLIDLN